MGTKIQNSSMLANKKRKSHQINAIHDAQGRLWEDQVGAFVHYYQQLFTSSAMGDMTGCLRAVKKKESPEMNATLLREFTIAKVSLVLHQIPPLKALGLDGFSADFYQKNWPVVGEEVSRAVINSLNSL